MEVIATDQAAAPLGHYSQAIKANNTVYVSGQLPIRPDGSFELGSAAAQTKVTLDNVKAVLEAAGASLNNIAKATIYIADIGLWPEVNDAYAAYFGAHKPARAAVPVPALPKGFLVEIEVVACV